MPGPKRYCRMGLGSPLTLALNGEGERVKQNARVGLDISQMIDWLFRTVRTLR